MAVIVGCSVITNCSVLVCAMNKSSFKSYIEAMILDEFTQEPYMTSMSYDCIHVQRIKPTNEGLYN